MKRKLKQVQQSESESEDVDLESDDEALQEAFAKGLIKPGVNVLGSEPPPKKVNNVARMKERLDEIILKLPWVERMDLITGLAPLAPEMAVQIEREEQKRENLFKGNAKIPYVAPEVDPVLNDFKREINFQRQAQAAIVEGISKLHAAGVETKRPDDYFAEMAKSDEHMQKVRKFLMDKQEGQKRSERVRQLREQRKMSKILQKQATQKKAEEKKKMLDEVKAFRKGKLKNLDFLKDDEPRKGGGGKKKKAGKGGGKKKPNAKRMSKDSKFGFGGKKRGSKRNTKESFIGGGGKKGGNKGAAKRPGKTQRAKNRAKSKAK